MIKRHPIASFFSLMGFIIIALYSIYQLRFVANGPKIEIVSPQHGTEVWDSNVIIRAKIENSAFIHLNDRQVFVNENNILEEKLPIYNGYNIITIKVTDGFGRQRESRITVIGKISAVPKNTKAESEDTLKETPNNHRK